MLPIMLSPETADLLSDNRQFNRLGYLSMQLNINFIFTNFTQGPFRQLHFAFAHLDTGGSHCIRNVARTDGAKQFAFIT